MVFAHGVTPAVGTNMLSNGQTDRGFAKVGATVVPAYTARKDLQEQVWLSMVAKPFFWWDFDRAPLCVFPLPC